VSRCARRSPLLRLESLEDRCVPATITVQNTADSGTGSLRQALLTANEGDTINFSPLLTGQTITLASELAVTKGVTITGPGAAKLTVSGNNVGRVFNVATAQTTSRVVITDLTLTNGKASADGGAVLDNGSNLTLTNVLITSSNATGNGGGLAVEGANAQLTANASTILGNTSSNEAAGVFVGTGATATLSASAIVSNRGATNKDGAGLFVDGTLTMTDGTVASNYGPGSTFSGGGLRNNGTSTITNSTFGGNATEGKGGAIFNSTGTLTLQNVTIVDNVAQAGPGGGILTVGGTVRSVHITVTGNADLGGQATGSGGISNAGATFTLQNSIVALNFTTNGAGRDVNGTFTTGSNLLSFVDANTNIVGGMAGDVVAADPLLGPLQNNGGKTRNRAPLPGSPAIDTGNNTFTPATLTTDQRGGNRTVNSTVDKGAVEFQPPASQTTLTVAPATTATQGAAVTLTATVAGTATGSNTPAGTVTFLANGSVIGTSPLGAGGIATFTTTDLPTGTVTLGATYNGDPNQFFTASTATTVSYTITAPAGTQASQVVLTSSANPLQSGASVTVTATVSAAPAPTGFTLVTGSGSTPPPTPTGTVTFLDGGTALGTAALNSSGQATISSTALTVGAHTIRAIYNGDSTYKPSQTTAPSLIQFVQGTSTIPTGITLAESVTSSFFTTPVTYTATVTSSVPGTPTPQGTVTFQVGNTVLGTATLNSAGVATLTTGKTPVGAFNVTAVYSGDSTFAGVTSMGLAHTTTRQSTIGSFDSTSGNWFLRNAVGAGNFDFGFVYGLPNWKPVVGDWNSDGIDTPGVVDPTTNTWYLRNENSPGLPDAATPFVFGPVNSTPVSGRFTAGVLGIGAVDRTGTFDNWMIRNSLTAGPPTTTFSYGLSSWIPLTGDWAGSGVTGIGVYDPSSGTFYLRNSASPGAANFTFQFGPVNSKPVVGDWDGNGTTTIGVVDSQGRWFIRNSNSSGSPDITPFVYGLPFWTPISGTWGPTTPLQLKPLGGPVASAGVADLTNDELQAAVAQALTRLQSAGVDPALVARLGQVQYGVADLGGAYLGLTYVDANVILINANAAGYGWFTDAGPGSDGAFAPGGTASGRMDLLTTVLHEMGHVAGLDDQPGAGNDLMAEFLAPGVRKTAVQDQVFAGGV
jgi:hypothetical protein